jgi:intracellular septation protein
VNPKVRAQMMVLLFGGILPVVAFAIVEDRFGVAWGTAAGMAFGVGEIVYEKISAGKVAGVTWFANAMILVLGAISLISNDGVWFKLQPAILLLFFGGAILVSSFMGKPLLVAMSLKQNPSLPEKAVDLLKTMNLRIGVLLLLLAGVSTWAALSWSTEAWAFLKGIGVTLILAVYLAGEIGVRRFLSRKNRVT